MTNIEAAEALKDLTKRTVTIAGDEFALKVLRSPMPKANCNSKLTWLRQTTKHLGSME